ncbi:MAG TPA: sulfur carrier protein ThiS [Gaiellaceae bacterium]|jgi:thiamine biosynthesis protein ThiS|nr:sulfur carrier protein ThiS [Gaiellaceae bacterium]
MSAICIVNGKDHSLEAGETVERLLARLGLEGGYALVERNGEPVERSKYREVELRDGDRIIVARPVAGG